MVRKSLLVIGCGVGALLAAWASPAIGAKESTLGSTMTRLEGAAATGILAALAPGSGKDASLYAVARQRSIERFDARKYANTERVTVFGFRRVRRHVPTNLLDQAVDLISARVSAASEENGYAVFTSWDDGDDSTWEGNLFVMFDLPTKGAVSVDTQFDISKPLPKAKWAELEFYRIDRQGDVKQLGRKHTTSVLPVKLSNEEEGCSCNLWGNAL